MEIIEDQCKETNTLINLEELQAQNTSLLAEIQSLKQLNENLELKHREAEDKFVKLLHELDDSQRKNVELAMVVEELLIQRDCVKSEIFAVEGRVREKEDDLLRKFGDGVREKECFEEEIYQGMRESEEIVREIDVGRREKGGFLEEIEVFEGRKEELKENFSRGFELLRLIKESLMRVYEGLGMKELGKKVDHESEGRKEDESSSEWEMEELEEMKILLKELDFILKMMKRIEEKLSDYQEKVDLLKEIEDCKGRCNELVNNFSKGEEVIGLVEVSLIRISEGFKVEKVEHEVDGECEGIMKEELSSFEDGLDLVTRMVKRVEHKMTEYQEKVKKEKMELESSVLSLTEENRDINALLRIALVEKEALEKSLIKLKGSNEQKRMPLFQFAGRSLQRVGFGFMMGGAAYEEEETQKKDGDQCSDNTTSNSNVASDFGSECEEEVVNLASAVENLMKKLRLEITHLKKDLDESRSDSERLQSLTEKQAQQITEQTAYIKELEEQKRTLTQNVEELLTEIKSTEEDVERWREACELEVEAGKRVIQERDKVVAILTQELEKTRVALQVSNTKIKIKEELARAAMAAQLAAERSLQLADSRAIGFRERIEALTRQLEEADSRGKNSKSKVSRICWPWQAFKLATPTNTDRGRVQNLVVKQMLPEMQALLQNV